MEVSRRNLQKYIAAQEAGSNRAEFRAAEDPRYRRAISRRLVAGDRCSGAPRRIKTRKKKAN